MIRVSLLAIALFFLLLAEPLAGQSGIPYPDDARRLGVQGRSLWARAELQDLGYISGDMSVEEAVSGLREGALLLEAAIARDPGDRLAAHDLCLLLTSPVIDDPGRAAEAVTRYTSMRPQDAYVVELWVRYRLDQLPDRESREVFLRETLPGLRDYPLVSSEALVELGLLALEKGLINDLPATQEQASQVGARSWFTQAFHASNFYNLDALAQLLALPEPELSSFWRGTEQQRQRQLENARDERLAQFAIQWRLALRNDPFDVNAARRLVDTLEALGFFELAQQYYPHLEWLLAEGGASGQLVREIRLRRLTSAYAGGLYKQAIELAEQLRRDEPDDLLVNAVLALALRETGRGDKASEIVRRTVAANLDRLGQEGSPGRVRLLELAWFFSFVEPDAQQAQRFVQEACEAPGDEPAPSRCPAIGAYASLLAGDTARAEVLLESADPNDPLTAIARARLLLDRQESYKAQEVLERLDQASLGVLVGTARDLAGRLGGNPPAWMTPRDPNEPDMIGRTFAARFNDNELQLAREPGKALSSRLVLDSDMVGYGDSLCARLYLANVSGQSRLPANLLLGPGGFVDPHAVILATVAPASRPEQAQTFVLGHRYLLEQRLLPVGETNSVSEYLALDPLGPVLRDHPQQEYELTFSMIIEPQPDGRGGFVGTLPEIQPAPVRVTRKAFVPTREQLANQLRIVGEGTSSQRVAAMELLMGLVREARLLQRGELDYRPQSVDTRALLEAVAANIDHPEAQVRAWAAYELASLGRPLAANRAGWLTQSLNDPDWFVRFLTIEALAPLTDLGAYFEWAAGRELDVLLERQALLLQGEPWPVTPLPIPRAPESAASPGG